MRNGLGMDMIQIQKQLLIIVFLIISFGISSAEIYTWVDEDGVKHYSDAPTRDTSKTAESSPDEIEARDPEPTGERPVDRDAQSASLDSDFFDFLKDSHEETAVSRDPVVEIYETDWCVYCKKAKNFFRSRGIEFATYDIEKDREAARRMMSMTSNRGVPFVVINGKGIQGFSEQAYTLALKN
jgi:glutaredoxin-like YruB-family protein